VAAEERGCRAAGGDAGMAATGFLAPTCFGMRQPKVVTSPICTPRAAFPPYLPGI